MDIQLLQYMIMSSNHRFSLPLRIYTKIPITKSPIYFHYLVLDYRLFECSIMSVMIDQLWSHSSCRCDAAGARPELV